MGTSDNPGLGPNLSLLSAVPLVPSPRARVTTLSNPLAASASRWTASRGTVLRLFLYLALIAPRMSRAVLGTNISFHTQH